MNQGNTELDACLRFAVPLYSKCWIQKSEAMLMGDCFRFLDISILSPHYVILPRVFHSSPFDMDLTGQLRFIFEIEKGV